MESPKLDVFIFTPSYSGDVHAGYAASLLQSVALLTGRGYVTTPYFALNNAVVSFVRTVGLKAFLDSGAKWFVSIDADLAWRAEDLLALVESPHDFTAGIYPYKTKDRSPMFQGKGIKEGNTGRYLEADAVPGGFTCVSRKAVEKMVAAYPDQMKHYKGKEVPFLYEHIFVKDENPLGEDYSFCKRWRDIGGKIFVLPGCEFTHYGSAEWQGCMLTDDPRIRMGAEK